MRRIHVNTAKEYDVLIGSGLLSDIGRMVAAIGAVRSVCIVSDSNVWPHYGQTVKRSITGQGLNTVEFVFAAGESSKNSETYLQLLSFLAEHEITRSDLIIALGGGVVGDLAGFAAATYLRGIAYFQVPTTLLAAVDSSVGGKTAIDLPAGKNLVGAFYQPALVLCDTDCLNTLPEENFRDGCAEVIKYGVLYDPELFAHLADKGLQFDREWVIARCVEWKCNVVAADEFDTGERMKLNLGHTVGHAVEQLSNFEISHGRAVAIGMAIVCRAGAAYCICAASAKDDILNILEVFGLPCSCCFDAGRLYRAALSDKKRNGGAVNLIIPRQIGGCIIHTMPVNEIEAFIKAGL